MKKQARTSIATKFLMRKNIGEKTIKEDDKIAIFFPQNSFTKRYVKTIVPMFSAIGTSLADHSCMPKNMKLNDTRNAMAKGW